MTENPRPLARFSRFTFRAALIAVLALALPACGSDSLRSSATADITAKDFSFTVTPVAAGATVTVRNESDEATHTVTADDGKSFDTVVDPGDDVTFAAPDKAGTFKFHCSIHQQMRKTLNVT